MLIATIVLSILLGLLFIVTGGMKLGSVPQSLAIRDHLGVKPELWRAIGFCEATGGVGLLVGLSLPVLGLAASIGLIVLMIGATSSRRGRPRSLRHSAPITMAIRIRVTREKRKAAEKAGRPSFMRGLGTAFFWNANYLRTSCVNHRLTIGYRQPWIDAGWPLAIPASRFCHQGQLSGRAASPLGSGRTP